MTVDGLISQSSWLTVQWTHCSTPLATATITTTAAAATTATSSSSSRTMKTLKVADLLVLWHLEVGFADLTAHPASVVLVHGQVVEQLDGLAAVILTQTQVRSPNVLEQLHEAV